MTAYILVVAKWRDDVFAGLFFDGLPPDLRRHIRILEFGNDSLTTALAGATAVIVMRHGLFSFGHLARCAAWARVPRYYFLDDNYLLLHEEPELYGPFWSAYSDEGVRAALKGFDGALLASRPLMQYFSDRALHTNLIEYPPIAWPVLRRRDRGWTHDTSEPFRVAFFGGEHRRDAFVTCVYPAVQRLASAQPVELVLAGIDSATLPPASSNLRVVSLAYELRYGAALADLARHNIDVLVHPTPPSRNNPYRNANVLINARSIGAVPVVSNLPPYDAFETPAPAILCSNDPDAWHAALFRLAQNPDTCAQVFDRTSRYCDEYFSGRANADAIDRMLSAHPAPGPLTRLTRSLLTAPALGLDRAIVRAKTIGRKSELVRKTARRLRYRAA